MSYEAVLLDGETEAFITTLAEGKDGALKGPRPARHRSRSRSCTPMKTEDQPNTENAAAGVALRVVCLGVTTRLTSRCRQRGLMCEFKRIVKTAR